MATFLALAGVSRTLRNLLEDRMQQPVPITIAPPDVQVAGFTERRANLYLYQVAENPHLKNQDLPGEGHPGTFGRPPLSLDLHYLVTAYGPSETGPDADLESQRILGDLMRAFHEFPLITPDLHRGDLPANPLILDTSLVGEFERIKITLQPSSLDDLSKLWTALPQANFRRSVAYNVSVVQIASRRRRATALPVRERRVYAFPIAVPRITEVRRDPAFDDVEGAIAEAGDTLLILGENLSASGGGATGTQVRVGDVLLPVAAPEATRASVNLPANFPAGVAAVQVVQDLLLAAAPGDPLVPHRGSESNTVPLLVLPRLTLLNPPAAGAGALVTATVSPPVHARQRKSLLLDRFEILAEPVAPDSLPSTTVQFRLPTGPAALPAGNYFARVRIDGAESRLTFNPATLQYTGPVFTVL